MTLTMVHTSDKFHTLLWQWRASLAPIYYWSLGHILLHLSPQVSGMFQGYNTMLAQITCMGHHIPVKLIHMPSLATNSGWNKCDFKTSRLKRKCKHKMPSSITCSICKTTNKCLKCYCMLNISIITHNILLPGSMVIVHYHNHSHDLRCQAIIFLLMTSWCSLPTIFLLMTSWCSLPTIFLLMTSWCSLPNLLLTISLQVATKLR